MLVEFILSFKTALGFTQTFRDYWIKTFRNENDEAERQEKYIPLHNDSDFEEFDKSKVSLMQHTQKG
jgi:hypothetical protein